MSETTMVALALGSNLGDRRALIERGVFEIARLESTTLLALSPVIETDPVGPAGQGKYLNCAALIETALAPEVLLSRLLEIEALAGRDRTRGERYGPRTLDIDILLYGERVIQNEGLTVPHARMHERRFVLEPLAAIAPEMEHPVFRRTVRELLDRLEGDR